MYGSSRIWATDSMPLTIRSLNVPGVTPENENDENSEPSAEATIFRELVNSMELPDLGNPEDRPDIFKEGN